MTPLWYFAYGSNLCAATFCTRRGMRPLAVERARLPGWKLVFDLPVGPGERGVANLSADEAAVTWGVCYLLDVESCALLDRTEGVHVGYYERLAVEVVADQDRRLAAFAYRGSRTAPDRRPSARYIDLLITGAREHTLPAEWIAHLERFPLAVDERNGSRVR